ncbi:hypothetical protein [Nitrosomonas eutropha]|nr:hypothetical protein [Nitrosomonas eutropha]SCX29442.1 hypothetical protein SAMN05216379_1552 [Nitrosomonas eutropha]
MGREHLLEKQKSGFLSRQEQGVIMLKQSVQLAFMTCVLAILCYTNTALGHGRVSLEEDTCVRQIGENMVHLNTYQPQFDRGGHYCTEIPMAGDTYLVVDLIDLGLRDMPVGMKVFRGEEKEGDMIIQVNAAHHPDGVINGIGRLDKGLYSVIVTAEGVPPLNYYYQLRVEMVDYGKLARTWAGPAIALLFLSWLLYKLIQSGRLKSWFKSEDD